MNGLKLQFHWAPCSLEIVRVPVGPLPEPEDPLPLGEEELGLELHAASNWERYNNPATDKLLDNYAITTDSAQQHDIVNQLQQVVLSDVPYIPVTEEVGWFQYNTAKFTGWPTQDNPYAIPAAYAYPDMGQVLLHLSPK